MYSSSSGGYTETPDAFIGAQPIPYLKGVPDPYAACLLFTPGSSLPLSQTEPGVEARGTFSGALRGIKVLKRGVSRGSSTRRVGGPSQQLAGDRARARVTARSYSTWSTPQGAKERHVAASSARAPGRPRLPPGAGGRPSELSVGIGLERTHAFVVGHS